MSCLYSYTVPKASNIWDVVEGWICTSTDHYHKTCTAVFLIATICTASLSCRYHFICEIIKHKNAIMIPFSHSPCWKSHRDHGDLMVSSGFKWSHTGGEFGKHRTWPDWMALLDVLQESVVWGRATRRPTWRTACGGPARCPHRSESAECLARRTAL